MADWKTYSIDEVLQEIRNDDITLPVVQRRLVWEEDKITLLFDSLLKGDSFGGMAAIEEAKDKKPLFEYRSFVSEASDQRMSTAVTSELARKMLIVIDGQQRLQAFYIGLLGTYEGKLLFFNLVGDPVEEFEFEFAEDLTRLAKSTGDQAANRLEVWFEVRNLYRRLQDSRDAESIASEIIEKKSVSEPAQQARVRKNIQAFYNAILQQESIGISVVRLNRTLPDRTNRQNVVELFRRLNQGGTRLSGLELVASKLKGFDWRIESFLDYSSSKGESLGLGRDEIIKLVLILQGTHAKGIEDVEEKDADFIVMRGDRLRKTLVAMEKFVDASGLRHYYENARRSAIPLYFVCHHIFHSVIDDEKIEAVFEQFDVKSRDFKDIEGWFYWSLLNGVFRGRGAGWTASTTGIRKIAEVMQERKGLGFPAQDLFTLYNHHPLRFFKNEIRAEYLDQFDRSFVFYLAYERQRSVRFQDEDHIHPKHILEKRKVDPKKIHSIVNFQLLDVATNRGLKQGKELYEFLATVEDPVGYLKRHLIPDDEKLWRSENFDEFFVKREQLLVDQLQKFCRSSWLRVTANATNRIC